MPSAPADPFDLERFVEGQRSNYDDAVAELSAGAKRTHWIWYVFPQIAGLGHSATAQRYAIGSLDEARAYLRHPVLGPRLQQCTALMLAIAGKRAVDVLGRPDDMKFHSSMTLFARAAPERGDFRAALERYFGGVEDRATLQRLEQTA